MADVRALKTVNRQWNSLNSEMTREIVELRFAHPTALLIKDLVFITDSADVENALLNKDLTFDHESIDDEEGELIDTQLPELFKPCGVLGVWFKHGTPGTFKSTGLWNRRREFDCCLAPSYKSDFFQFWSDRKSGIVLGRVLGWDTLQDVFDNFFNQ